MRKINTFVMENIVFSPEKAEKDIDKAAAEIV